MTISLSRSRAYRPTFSPLSIRAMITVRQERRALALMGPDRLADLGISPQEAAIEVARPFWDLPMRRR